MLFGILRAQFFYLYNYRNFKFMPLVLIGKGSSFFFLVGGKIKAINGTENIDIPIPTEPLTIPPKKTEHKITVKVTVSKYSKYMIIL